MRAQVRYSNYQRSRVQKDSDAFKIDPSKVWLVIFCIWGLLLTGVFSSWIGSPGMLQAHRLKKMLANREDLIHSFEGQIALLDSERNTLEKSTIAQEREIRRVLGYAYSDELIFDFSAAKFVK